jgi:ribulose-phosphate 3-epimerase
MLEVYPSINCPHKDFECVRQKVRKSESFAQWIHLDIADARLALSKSWDEPERWGELGTKLNLEVHLMVEEPEREIEKWLKAGAKRIIVHIEAISKRHPCVPSCDASELLKKLQSACGKHGVSLMLAILPETPIETLRESCFKDIREFQVFAQAVLGPPGQKFLPMTVDRIKLLREMTPDATIEIDGGINLETARAVRVAGANIVIAGSYTLGSPDPKKAYEELVNA